MFKSKRAQERMVYTLNEIIATFLIAIIIITASVAYGKGEPYEKLYLAKDIAMNINALHAIKGDFNFIYSPDNLAKYSYKIKDGLVTVVKDNFDESSRAEYPFIANKDTLDIDVDFRNPVSLTFIKKASKIIIIQEVQQPETTTICKETENKNPNWRQQEKILIDTLDQDLPSKIANLLKSKINPETVSLIEQGNKLQQLSFINPSILIILEESNENSPKIILSPNKVDETSIFQCLLTKHFAEETTTTTFSDSDVLLNKAPNLAVKIQINPKKYSQEQISNIIQNAIKNYYE